MEQGLTSISHPLCLILILIFIYNHNVSANVEVEALFAFKKRLVDPNGKLEGWDSDLVNPCSWPHVRCLNDQTVIKLNLGSFNLTGSLAPELGQLSNLRELALYNNNLNGTIPSQLGNLKKLNHLDLSSNNLAGTIPDSLGNLLQLEKLKLNHNNLSGEVPMSLTAITTLKNLDLSFNQLTGDVPVNGSFSKFTKSSFDGNPDLNMTAISSPPNSFPGSNNSIGAIAGGVAAGVTVLIAAIVLALTLLRHKIHRDEFIDVPEEFHPGQLKKFSFQELQIATDNFSKDNIIGKGGYANVYKGRLTDGTLVAIKRLKAECSTKDGEIQFQTEVELISRAIHRNLIRLHGYCTTLAETLLVYPLMTNGSVASCLRERKATQAPLSWEIRKRIAVGVARGLAYMHEHCEQKIIHRDVKTDNIFLDKEYEAVVGDFGLAKLMDYKHTHVTTKICGTIGYIAPEYFSTGKSSEKTDVFGYGAMLLEVVAGQRAFQLAPPDNRLDVTWLDWVIEAIQEKKMKALVDPSLEGKYIEAEAEQLVKIALLCRQTEPLERPKMSEVVRMLEGHDSLTEKWVRWEHNENLNDTLKYIHPSNFVQILDSTPNLSPEELSGAR